MHVAHESLRYCVRGNVTISRFVASNLIVPDGRVCALRFSHQTFRDKVKHVVGKHSDTTQHNKRTSVNTTRIFCMEFLLYSIEVLCLISDTKYSD
jgi:hypothetical protein